MGTSHQGMKLLPGKHIISGSLLKWSYWLWCLPYWFQCSYWFRCCHWFSWFYWFWCSYHSSFRMRQLLQLYASDSADLISRYYWERIKEQRNLQVEPSLISLSCNIFTKKNKSLTSLLNTRSLGNLHVEFLNYFSLLCSLQAGEYFFFNF